MKNQFLILIILVSLLSNCNQKKIEKQIISKSETNLKIKNDTTVVYWQTNFDTIRENKNINIENEKYKLKLKTYSLNDSSIVKINDTNKPNIYKDIYHDYVTEIVLKNENNIILKSQIKKSTFKDSLDGDFLKYSVLKSVEYHGIRSNRLYFRANIDVPDTDWTVATDFTIFYQTQKKGRIHFWFTKN